METLSGRSIADLKLKYPDQFDSSVEKLCVPNVHGRGHTSLYQLVHGEPQISSCGL